MKFPPDPPTEEELEEILPDPPSADDIERIEREIEEERENWDPHNLPDSQEQLVRDLHASDAPAWMIEKTAQGIYHDYVSPHFAPKHLLVEDAESNGLHEIAERAKRGDYDP